MLALTPVPLQTAGERALFAELTRWDTGGAVRAAVVASIPLVDGPLQRRLSDAVLFVPEGIAVVRVVEVDRQSGIVTAAPRAPGRSARRGAGRGPAARRRRLHAARRADARRDGRRRPAAPRRAGARPDRPADRARRRRRPGCVPADGDLGEGDQVALLDTALAAAGHRPRQPVRRRRQPPALDDRRRPRRASRRSGLPGRGPVGGGAQRRGVPLLAVRAAPARSC